MRISDQSNVTPQLDVTSLTISSEREDQTAPIHPINKTGIHIDEDPSPPNYEDAMAMRNTSTSLHM